MSFNKVLLFEKSHALYLMAICGACIMFFVSVAFPKTDTDSSSCENTTIYRKRSVLSAMSHEDLIFLGAILYMVCAHLWKLLAGFLLGDKSWMPRILLLTTSLFYCMSAYGIVFSGISFVNIFWYQMLLMFGLIFILLLSLDGSRYYLKKKMYFVAALYMFGLWSCVFADQFLSDRMPAAICCFLCLLSATAMLRSEAVYDKAQMLAEWRWYQSHPKEFSGTDIAALYYDVCTASYRIGYSTLLLMWCPVLPYLCFVSRTPDTSSTILMVLCSVAVAPNTLGLLCDTLESFLDPVAYRLMAETETGKLKHMDFAKRYSGLQLQLHRLMLGNVLLELEATNDAELSYDVVHAPDMHAGDASSPPDNKSVEVVVAQIKELSCDGLFGIPSSVDGFVSEDKSKNTLDRESNITSLCNAHPLQHSHKWKVLIIDDLPSGQLLEMLLFKSWNISCDVVSSVEADVSDVVGIKLSDDGPKYDMIFMGYMFGESEVMGDPQLLTTIAEYGSVVVKLKAEGYAELEPLSKSIFKQELKRPIDIRQLVYLLVQFDRNYGND